MTQSRFNEGSFCVTSGSGFSLHATDSSATFIYPTTQAHVVRSYRARRRRLCSLSATRWIFSSLCIFCFAVLLSGSMLLLLGIYASENLQIGINFSRLYTANSLFVKRIVVSNRLQSEGPVIYGFSSIPPLNQEVAWTEVHNTVLSSNHHQEWSFWLNKGSQVELQYNISDPDMELLLVVIQGEENMQKWIQDLSNFDLVSSSKIAQGEGSLEHEVENDYNYYFALGNMQSSSAKVDLQIRLQSKAYSMENHTSQCRLTSAPCAVNLQFLGSNVLLLTTSQVDQGGRAQNGRFKQQGDGPWSVTVAFEQRWTTYLLFWGAFTIVLLVLLVLCKPSSHDSQAIQDIEEPVTLATPLTTSYEAEEKLIEPEHPAASASNFVAEFHEEGNESLEDYLCIICFERHKNCFFDPCGHSATCYVCSMKILKEKRSLCPLCREPIRLVRRLFLH